jgi:hypothetical protein
MSDIKSATQFSQQSGKSQLQCATAPGELQPIKTLSEVINELTSAGLKIVFMPGDTIDNLHLRVACGDRTERTYISHRAIWNTPDIVTSELFRMSRLLQEQERAQ